MSPPLPEHLLAQLSEHLASQTGWLFPVERHGELAAGIEAAARDARAPNVLAFARELLYCRLSAAQIEALAGAFTVGETYFFRDSRSFEILEQDVLPALIRARRSGERRLRIWSAGCCTGEEAYSLAMLLHRLLPDLDQWQITLLATDINVRFLHRAAQGIYGEWSFRGAPAWLRQRYFQPVAKHRYQIAPRIRALVTFAFLNLADDSYPALTTNTNAMDLILCRNVLMYFSAERAHEVIRKLHHCLVAGGLFLTSAVEASPRFSGYFDAAPYEGATFYARRSDSAAALPMEARESETVAFAGPAAAELPLQQAQELTHGVLSAHSNVPDRPTQPERGYAAALELFGEGRYLEAAHELLSNAADVERDVDGAMLLARIHANTGALQAARTWADHAVSADRTNAAAHYLRAVILQEQNDLAAAAAALQKTLYLQPEFVLGHFSFGNLEQQRRHDRAARRHFNNALRLLRGVADDAVLPHSDGMAAGRLRDMIRSMVAVDAA